MPAIPISRMYFCTVGREIDRPSWRKTALIRREP
jgi:hypothetical protein